MNEEPKFTLDGPDEAFERERKRQIVEHGPPYLLLSLIKSDGHAIGGKNIALLTNIPRLSADVEYVIEGLRSSLPDEFLDKSIAGITLLLRFDEPDVIKRWREELKVELH